MKRLLLFSLCLAAPPIQELVAAPPVLAGDRVAIIGNTFADQLRIHGYLETLLNQRSKLSLRNLGWAGDRLTARDRPTGFPTEESTLKEHKTDTIIACFGMGESFAGEAGLARFRSDLEGFIATHSGKSYNGESEVRLVLVSPIANEDLGELTPALDRRNAELGAYTGAMREIATSAGLPFVDLFEPSRYLMEEQAGPNLTTNGITLNQFGYWALCHVFFEQLTGEVRQAWRLDIDAKAKTGTASGVGLARISTARDVVTFSVEELSPPSLRPPGDPELPPQLASQRDTLVVVNLAPGRYTLSVDGEEVVTAQDDQWAAGVAIDTSPSHREAEALRDAINDKNLQFTYSWKALNQVHIVGERKSSPSGRALPAELVEFNKLARQREGELTEIAAALPRERRWQLAPARNTEE
ncbi:MAG: SGNH/GDSL hydrolase family protein [Verrucomicrobiales bacterium]